MDIIRDPIWNNIRVDALALELVDTAVFQRLRYVRQLGLAHLVYPGATHTRFEHALGAYHLARTTLALLADRGDLGAVPEQECATVRAALLLHDVGHYPFSHAVEEIGVVPHELIAGPLITDGPVADLLTGAIGADAPERVLALIRGRSRSALQGLVSGSLDLDKIEYLKRDAVMCGVPYGEIDVDRLVNAFVVVEEAGTTGGALLAVREKGLSALESLLFAKYQMYRNVYWHHAVRSATAMYKRLVHDAFAAGALNAASLAVTTDDAMLHHLATTMPSPLLDRLRERRLYKRALECPAAELDGSGPEWIATDPGLAVAAEDAIAAELGLRPGELLLDFPAKTEMLGLDIPVLRRTGEVRRLTTRGLEGVINLTVLSEQLYRSARWLRVFVARGVNVPRHDVLNLLQRPAEDIRGWVRGAARSAR